MGARAGAAEGDLPAVGTAGQGHLSHHTPGKPLTAVSAPVSPASPPGGADSKGDPRLGREKGVPCSQQDALGLTGPNVALVLERPFFSGLQAVMSYWRHPHPHPWHERATWTELVSERAGARCSQVQREDPA